MLCVDKEGVQIMAGPAGRKGKPAGIDIIRTFFKRSYVLSEGFPCRRDADRQDGLSRPSSQS